MTQSNVRRNILKPGIFPIEQFPTINKFLIDNMYIYETVEKLRTIQIELKAWNWGTDCNEIYTKIVKTCLLLILKVTSYGTIQKMFKKKKTGDALKIRIQISV